MPVLPLPQSLSTLKDVAKVQNVDCPADFNNLYSKMLLETFTTFTVFLADDSKNHSKWEKECLPCQNF